MSLLNFKPLMGKQNDQPVENLGDVVTSWCCWMCRQRLVSQQPHLGVGQVFQWGDMGLHFGCRCGHVDLTGRTVKHFHLRHVVVLLQTWGRRQPQPAGVRVGRPGLIPDGSNVFYLEVRLPLPLGYSAGFYTPWLPIGRKMPPANQILFLFLFKTDILKPGLPNMRWHVFALDVLSPVEMLLPCRRSCCCAGCAPECPSGFGCPDVPPAPERWTALCHRGHRWWDT